MHNPVSKVKTPVVSRRDGKPTNDSAMVPDQKRCEFTRPRECNAHPARMPITPNGMPANQNDCEKKRVDTATIQPIAA